MTTISKTKIKINKDNFSPVYDTDVTISFGAPGSVKVPVSPLYCLSVDSANELQQVLNDNGLGPVSIEMLPPSVGFIRFNYSRDVPWFVYGNGTKENAGFVSMNWVPNRNGDIALLYAAQEIHGVMNGE